MQTLATTKPLGLPNTAATQIIEQDIGLGTVRITYGRPNVQNRHIFGGLVPYDVIWRTGANSATEISFSEPVQMCGFDVPAGTYSLFTIPGKEEWTIILNKDIKSWGAYSYDEQRDLLRFVAKIDITVEKHETFTISLAHSTSDSAVLVLRWDHVSVGMAITVDLDARIMANIDAMMQTEHPDNLAYFNAIQYFYNHQKDIDKALGWIARAKADIPSNPAFHLFESRFLLRKGDRIGAVAAAEAGIQLATTLQFDEYIMLNSEALELAKLKKDFVAIS